MLERIRAEIASHGPMPFDRFMELALYDPEGGYFAASSTLRSSTGGDFLTSPEVSPLFGATLAAFVAAEGDRIGHPPTLIEAGSGSGSLLRPLLDALPEPPDAVFAVEVSPAASSRIAATVPECMVVESLAEIPRAGSAIVIANELLDNLPAAVAVRRDEGWREKIVVLADDHLALDERPARSEVASWSEAYSGRLPEGAIVEVQLEAGAWLTDALALFDSGAVVVIDYGDTAAGLEHRRAQGTLRTYRSHHLGPDPLLTPGETDITMDVNFTALGAAAEAAGAGITLDRQDEFLARWGLRDALSDLRASELKAARAGNTMERLRLRSRVTDAETLLHPRGLGDFRVLVARR